MIGYMCRTDFECELGHAKGGNIVFPSIADAKENLKCWESCGIVEVEVTFKKVVIEGHDDVQE